MYSSSMDGGGGGGGGGGAKSDEISISAVFLKSFYDQDVLRRPVRDAAQCPQDAGRGVEVGRSSLQGQL